MTIDTTPPPPSVHAEIAAGLGLSLAQAARLIPPCRAPRRSDDAAGAAPADPRRDKAPVNASTVWRWIRKGVRLPSGELLRLEGARLSGRWLTSGPALERFLAGQTPAADSPPRPAPRTPNQQRKASERAARELNKIGI